MVWWMLPALQKRRNMPTRTKKRILLKFWRTSRSEKVIVSGYENFWIMRYWRWNDGRGVGCGWPMFDVGRGCFMTDVGCGCRMACFLSVVRGFEPDEDSVLDFLIDFELNNKSIWEELCHIVNSKSSRSAKRLWIFGEDIFSVSR